MSGEKQDRGACPPYASVSELLLEVVDEEGNPVVISEAAQALPQINSSGMVRNLGASAATTYELRGTKAKFICY